MPTKTSMVLLPWVCGLTLVASLQAGCSTSNPEYCQKNSDCPSGHTCDVVRAVCVSADGAAGTLDGPARPIDGQLLSLDTAADAADATARPLDTAAQPVDTANHDAPVAFDVPIDGGVDANVPDRAADLRIPDAAGTCAVNSDCPDPTKAFCVAGLCTGCQVGIDGGSGFCLAPTGVCDVATGKCVGCTADTQCSAAKPVCDKTKNSCATCTTDGQCQAKSLALPACRADGQCVQCNNSTSCSGAAPACDTTTNTCVQCTTAANCTGATPVCSNDKCQACKTGDECAALKDATRAVCATTGACVQCNANTDCSGATPVCDTTVNACVGCLTSATCATAAPICASTKTCAACTSDAQCLAKNPALPGCRADGQCVQCTANTQCSGTTPICSTTAPVNTCRACALDAECAGIGPAVCMLDGHCAADTDAIHVGSTGSVACNANNSGTAQSPVCSLQGGVGLAQQGGKSLVIVTGTLSPASTLISVSTPLTIVGKNNATIAPTTAVGSDCITITRGVIYLRSLTIQGGTSTGVGISAAPTSGSTVTLYVDSCKITNNPGGGIVINGANFDIENTFVTGNGVNGLSTSGGIFINNPPAGGPVILNRVTIQSNDGGGLSCSGPIQGTGVLSFGNTSTVSQIGASCAISSCTSDGGTGCGAS